MQFSAAAVLALVASVSATYNGTVVYTTEVHTAYTTYCPVATTLTYGPSTYTVSASQTLTVTACPGGCTIVKPITTYPYVACSTCAGTPPTYTAPPAYPTANATVPASTGSYQPGPTTSTIPITGGANKAVVGPLAGLLGLAAYLL